MNERIKNLAIPGLSWCVGLMVLWQSWRFAFGTAAAREFAGTGLPSWIRPALGGVEIAAAVLFLVPITAVVGGYALLVVFFFAAVLHVLHGWYDVSGLVLYAMAVLVSLAHRDHEMREGQRGAVV
jgi:DoxX-like family